MKIKGWGYWFLTCIIASSIYSYLFTKNINSSGAFSFNFSDSIVIFLILFILSIILSTPLMLLMRYIYSRYRSSRMGFFIQNLTLLLYSILFLITVMLLSLTDLNDGMEIVVPYIGTGFVALNLYLFIQMKEKRLDESSLLDR